MYTLAGSNDASRSWVPATHLKHLGLVLGSSFQPGPAVTGVGIWTINQQKEDLDISLHIYNVHIQHYI